MKKKLFVLLVMALSFGGFANAQAELSKEFSKADSLLKTKNIFETYSAFSKLMKEVDSKDKLYREIYWKYTVSLTKVEQFYRMAEKWDSSLYYGKLALEIIRNGKSMFDDSFGKREFWMVKNVLVSSFGQGDLESAMKYRKELYSAYKAKKLPEGLNEYFNYTYFKLNDKNIWAYEWFEDLPKDRFSTSFTKIVYYVYSTNEDGSDKDQVCRFHVLMFHQSEKNPKFDYILERQIDTENELISGSYYNYVYKEKIDYEKLKKDVIEILTLNIEPDSRRVIRKNK